jgi:hypothetical protein
MCGPGGDRFGVTDTPLREGLLWEAYLTLQSRRPSNSRARNAGKEDKRKTEGRFLDISPVSRCSRSQFFTHFLDVSMSAFVVGCVVFRVNQINIQLVLIIFSVSGYFHQQKGRLIII